MINRPGLVRVVKQAFARADLEVHRKHLGPDARRMAAIRHHKIDVVLDVGANYGQYVGKLREGGYLGSIVSFEPIPAAFRMLSEGRRTDSAWTGRQEAAGPTNTTIEFNVSEDSVTSSVLAPDDELLSRIASAATSQQIQVQSRTLESIWTEITSPSSNVMLKIDVQGFEHGVLDGLGDRVGDVALIEVEMGLTRLYEGGSTLYDLLPRLHSAGYEVISIDSGFVDSRTGQVLDIDMLMGRRS